VERPDIEQIQSDLTKLEDRFPPLVPTLKALMSMQEMIDYILFLEKQLQDWEDDFHEMVEREVLKG
jgi:hypothetical protein